MNILKVMQVPPRSHKFVFAQPSEVPSVIMDSDGVPQFVA